jgi:predicted RNA-binding protein
MSENNYYMIITSPEDFEIDLKNNLSIIGLPDRNKRAAKNFAVGDKIVFYISKMSLFGGIAEVTGEYYYHKKKIWTDHYDLWPHRVSSKPLYLINDFNKMIFIKEIWDDLDFIKTKGSWGVYVQGSFRKLSKHEFKVILQNLKGKNTAT